GTTAAVAKRLGRNYLAFEREDFYVGLAKERLQNIAPLDSALLQSKVEKRRFRIPFGNLVEKGLIKVGEQLCSKKGHHTAVVLADASVVCKGMTGSIHRVSAAILQKETSNGWMFWYVKRNGKLLCIDRLRDEYEATYLQPPVSTVDPANDIAGSTTELYV
ncbi:MAG TPA: hypothetical protein VFL47_07695, partial [Flavisolibacter sp.]|nr:hypothetical protein [Flavisolibacter sp.]